MSRKNGRLLLYGEETVQLNIRVPKSKKDEINEKFYLILDSYIDLKSNTIEKPEQLNLKDIASIELIGIEKKSNPTDIVIEDVIFDPMREKVKALQEMANTIKDNSSIGVSKNKVAVEDEYDCVEVTSGLPSIIDRIYYGTRTDIAFWDKDDVSVYYVKWDGKYYKFVDSSEFNRFAKDKNIK